jgi:hypothetical protein
MTSIKRNCRYSDDGYVQSLTGFVEDCLSEDGDSRRPLGIEDQLRRQQQFPAALAQKLEERGLISAEEIVALACPYGSGDVHIVRG